MCSTRTKHEERLAARRGTLLAWREGWSSDGQLVTYRQTDRLPGSSIRCFCATRGPTRTGCGSRSCRDAGAGAQSPRHRSPSLHADGSTWESTCTAPDAGAADAAMRVLCQRRCWLRNACPALTSMCSPQKCSPLFSAGSRKAPGTASGTRAAAPRNHGQTTRSCCG